MGIQLKNNASGTLATAISASDTGIVLTTGNGASFPALAAGDYFYATLESIGGTQEIVKVTARSGDSLTIARAQDGSTANSFAAGSRFEMRVNAGALVGYVQDRIVSVKDFGATGNGVANDTAAFTAAGSIAARVQVYVPAGVYKLDSNPTPTGFVTWIIQQGASFTGAGKLPYGGNAGNILAASKTFNSIESDPAFYDGIFKYLEENSALTGYGVIGLHGSVKSSDSAGTPGTARIGVAGFGVNDFVGGAAGVWGLYSTVVREAVSTGFTHGLEIDVANFGPTVSLTPAVPFAFGLTSGIWLCTGGETTEPSVGGSPGVASVGLAIIQNDSQGGTKTAKFDKGIMFHNQAISGADGTGGSNIGIAIAFATGHSMTWFNNLNQVTAEITNTGATFANTGVRLDFSNFGVLIQDRATGQTSFQVQKTANAVNGVAILPGATGDAGVLLAIGETNVDLGLQPKGAGFVDFRNASVSAVSGAQFGYFVVKINGASFKVPLYHL